MRVSVFCNTNAPPTSTTHHEFMGGQIKEIVPPKPPDLAVSGRVMKDSEVNSPNCPLNAQLRRPSGLLASCNHRLVDIKIINKEDAYLISSIMFFKREK